MRDDLIVAFLYKTPYSNAVLLSLRIEKNPVQQGFYNILAHPTGIEPATVRIGI